jgi:hypothetical protein
MAFERATFISHPHNVAVVIPSKNNATTVIVITEQDSKPCVISRVFGEFGIKIGSALRGDVDTGVLRMDFWCVG